MSKVVDERVVEMRFDNDKFEKNVKTTMSTLDKFKEKLKFSGASKGFEEINTAANKVSFNKLEQSINAIQNRFSTMGIVGMRVIENLTDKAMMFVSKIRSFVTDGIVSGGIRRATNLENAQFQLQGLLNDAEAVEAVMKNVNDAVDGTAYSLDAAATVASQLAASGMKAGDEMFSALRGVAGVAAMTNSSYEDIGRIYTQVAGQGKLMGDQLLQLSGRGMNAAATLAKYLNKSEAEVREMTSKGEIDFKTFAAAMDDAFGEHAKKANDTLTGSMANVKSALARIGAAFVTPLIKTNGPLVQFFNALREKVNDLKTAVLPFAETTTTWLSKIIDKGTELVKKIDLQGWIDKFKKLGQNNPFSDLAKRIDEVTQPAQKAAEAVQDFSDVVDKVVNGDFGNGEARFKALTEAGYDWAHIQNLVNEKLGDSTRHTTDFKESQEDLNKEQATTIDQLLEMSDAQLTAIGFTDDEVKAFRELEEQSKKTGIPIKDLIEDTSKLSSKSLLLDSFRNIGESIVKVFKAIGEAWKETFDGDNVNILYDIVAGFHKVTTWMSISDEDADKLKRTFKGLFALLDIVSTLVGGGLKLAFKVLAAILDAFDISVLDLTAGIGDLLVKFRDFLFSNDLITKGFDKLASGVKMVIGAIKDLIDAFLGIPKVQEAIENLKNIDMTEIGKNILAGLKNGLEGGITSIPKILVQIGQSIITAIKDVLGIHSPSTVMTEIGEYTMEGYHNGLTNGLSGIREFIKGLGASIIQWFQDMNWGKVIALSISSILLVMVKNLSKSIMNVTELFSGAGSVLEGVGSVLSSVSTVISKAAKPIAKILKNVAKVVKAFANVLNAQAFKLKAEGVKDLALSLLALAGAVYILAQLDTGKLWSSVGALTVLSLVLAALAIGVSKMSESSMSIDKHRINIKGVKTCLLSIGIALLLMAATVKIIGSMDPDKCTQGFAGLAGMVGAIVLVVTAFGKLVDEKQAKNIDKVGKMMRKMAVSMLIMAVVLKVIGSMPIDQYQQGCWGLVAMAGVMTLMIVAFGELVDEKKAANIDKVGKMLLELSAAMILMAVVVKIAGTFSTGEMIKGAGFAVAFLGFLALVMLISKIDGKEMTKVGTNLLKISFAMLLLAGVVKVVSMLSPKEMVKGGIFAVAFIAFLAALMAVTNLFGGGKLEKVGTSILAISVAIGIMAGVCILLGMIDIANLAKGVIAVGILGAMLALMIRATKDAKQCMGNIIAMGVVIAIMATAVAALSFIAPEKLVAPVAALSVLMGMFAIVEKAGSNIQKATGTMVAMAVIIGILSAALCILATLPSDSVIASAASIALVMGSLAVVLKIISSCKKVATSAMVALGILTFIVGILGVILYALGEIDATATLANAAALSVLITALSVSLAIISKVPVTGAIEGAVGLAAFIGIMAAVLAVLGGLAQIPGLQDIIADGGELLATIGYAIGKFVGSIVGGFTAGVSSGLPEIGTNLSSFMLNVTPFLVGMNMVDGDNLLKGVGALTAAVIMLTAAELISAIASFISQGSSFADLGKELSSFMLNATPFIVGASMLTEDMMNGVKTLAETILILTAADVLNGVTSWLTGGSSLTEFAQQLIPFGVALSAFSAVVSGNVDEEAVSAAANCGKLLTEMADSIPNSGGLAGFFAGENDIDDFAKKLIPFGVAIVIFSSIVSGHVDEEAVRAAANAGQMMSDMADTIPNSGGLVEFFTGGNDIDDFGRKMLSFGKSIAIFSTVVSGHVSEEAVAAAANAGQMMVDLSDTIPNSGGLVEFFTGGNDIDDFGKKIAVFGLSLCRFSECVKDISSDDVTTAKNCGDMMVELNNAIPETGGIKSLWSGESNLASFGSNIAAFGTAMASFSESVSGNIDEDAAQSAINVAMKLNDLAPTLQDTDYSGYSLLNKAMADDISKFAMSLVLFSNSLEQNLDSDAITSATDACMSFVDMTNEVANVDFDVLSNFADTLNDLADDMSSIDVSGMSTFGEKLGEIGTTGVDKLINAFKEAGPKASEAGKAIIQGLGTGVKQASGLFVNSVKGIVTQFVSTLRSAQGEFMTSGSTMMTNLTMGITSKKSTVENGIKSTVESASNSVREYYTLFSSAGAFLVSGFAKGIDDNRDVAKKAAKAMAQSAYNAAKKELDINSPSKKFEYLAQFVPSGFANGIVKYGDVVSDATAHMGRLAMSGAEKTLSDMTSIINDDIDAQPTIRPVLDLTNVKKEAGYISGLFNSSASVGVDAELSSISTMMNRNRQNGANDDVVGAINKLRKDVNGISKPTYNVGNVTYDDGSNVSDAVETLIRAIVVDGRS